ncbi:hypothetical protein BBP40_011065 [Aspergillus hancockii]|nr:hypothetical protein BBP40_011065 [Aspergillus hancockii]
MAEIITEVPYNHEVYHLATKPSLHAATENFDSRNVQNAINTVIRDCFLRHNVQKQFSACLLHRHFDLKPDERNIEENGRAAASTNFNNIYACSWLFYDGKLFPYEFKRGMPLPTPSVPFITELGAILQANDLWNIIGIQAYTDGFVGMETTDHEAKVSTTVEYSECAPELKETKAAMASFAFF